MNRKEVPNIASRPFAHWSFRYGVDRMRLAWYQLTHPDAPWLTPRAVDYLSNWLRPHHVGFEWGAGRSTIWFALRVHALTSVEHDPEWYRRTRARLSASSITNVTIELCPAEAEAYVMPASHLPDQSLDFVLVDGVSALRDLCATVAIPKVRPGGLLILDDIHRYLPSSSRAPLARPAHMGPLTEGWGKVLHQLSGWTFVTTTSGVTDTLIVRRPDSPD